MRVSTLVCCLIVLSLAVAARAAELVRLNEKNWSEYAPHGKEADAIYGDFVLRNDRIVAVIANPIHGRHANLTVSEVAGCIVDLAQRGEAPRGTGGIHPENAAGGNDQLSAYYPNAMRTPYRAVTRIVLGDASPSEHELARVASGGPCDFKAKSVLLQVASDPGLELAEIARVNARRAEKDKLKLPANPKPRVTTSYLLADGDDHITVITMFVNVAEGAITVDLGDSFRTDRTFEVGGDASLNLVWSYDRWWNQCYAVVGDKVKALAGAAPVGRAPSTVHYDHEGKRSVTLEKRGDLFVLSRKLFVGGNVLDVKASAAAAANEKQTEASLTLQDSAGGVANADVIVNLGDKMYGRGRTNGDGRLTFKAPAGDYTLQVYANGRTAQTVPIRIDADAVFRKTITLDDAGYVVAHITDAKGGPIPCKVQFIDASPKEETKTKAKDKDKNKEGKDAKDAKAPAAASKDPFFFVDSGEHAVHNCYYSHTGQFKQEIGPGTYDVIISYGPEYDAIFTRIEVARGKETKLTGKLVRTVDTKGWISSDFHSHASPSGDNTSSQYGRVLNLLCEHIEFAPCTEHQRIDSYTPHLKKLGVEHLLATCTGMELTGKPLPLNHHNVFPLIHRPHEQDGGGPVVDYDPTVQIERVYYWDNGAEKVVQQNHPDIIKMFFDKDGDGKEDGGLQSAPFMNVIEVHPPEGIFKGPKQEQDGKPYNNTIFNWMQTLNKGYRVPGVVNTDAHYNFHGSGWLRNWIKSPTDDPSKAAILDIVRETNKGHLVMSTGPFLETSATDPDLLRSEPPTALPGDNLRVLKGRAQLHVRVQCPNWFDVNRVQVFVNGRADAKLNFTRKNNPDLFTDKAVRFEQTITVELKEDAHLIVATIGEGLSLGKVMGPSAGKNPPVAVANPIYIDVDGGGFKANGDMLGAPLAADEPAKEKK